MGTTFIYALIDPRDNQIRYIGKTNNIKTRLKEHCTFCSLQSQTHKNNWVKLLLKENLKPEIEIVDEVNESEWQFWEKHYISLYKSWGFKLTNSNDGGHGGLNPCLEVKLQMSLKRKGVPKSEQHKKRISYSLKGVNNWSKGENNPSKREQVREKKRLKMKGKKASIETRLKLSKIRKGKTAHNKGITGYENHAIMKQVKATNILTKEEFIFKSIKEASKCLNVRTWNVSNCLRGKQKTTNGYTWEYKNK